MTEYQQATALYAAQGGEWVEVPLGGGTPLPPAEWTRPTDWLPTNVTAGEQKIQLLVHVGADMTVEVPRTLTVMATPDYTVDWGDGTAAENVASGVTAKHLYDTAALAGTATSEGWLQALVTLTPQASGSFATLNLAQSYYTGTGYYHTPAVEVVVGPSLSGFVLVSGNNTAIFTKRVEFKSPVTLALPSTFYAASELREIVGEIIASASNSLQTLFYTCSKLAKFPTITVTYAGTTGTANGMFWGCSSMTEVPSFNGGNCTDFSNIFLNCTSLRDTPTWLNTSRGTNFTSMFSGCSNLVNVTLFDTSKATNVTAMFENCASLVDVPLFNTALVTNFSAMFNNCTNLVHVPTFNTVKGNTLTNMFYACRSLAQIPPFNLAVAGTMIQMFNGCTSLTEATVTFKTAGNIQSFFSACTSMTTITNLDLSFATSAGQMFSGCTRLTKIGLLPGKGPKINFDALQSTVLDAAALNDFYTQLPVVSGLTIYVSGAFGTLGDDPTIATAKGWIVNGS